MYLLASPYGNHLSLTLCPNLAAAIGGVRRRLAASRVVIELITTNKTTADTSNICEYRYEVKMEQTMWTDNATYSDALPVKKLATHDGGSTDVYQATASLSRPSRRRRRWSQHPQWTADGRHSINHIHSRVHDSRDANVMMTVGIVLTSDARARHG